MICLTGLLWKEAQKGWKLVKFCSMPHGSMGHRQECSDVRNIKTLAESHKLWKHFQRCHFCPSIPRNAFGVVLVQIKWVYITESQKKNAEAIFLFKSCCCPIYWESLSPRTMTMWLLETKRECDEKLICQLVQYITFRMWFTHIWFGIILISVFFPAPVLNIDLANTLCLSVSKKLEREKLTSKGNAVAFDSFYVHFEKPTDPRIKGGRDSFQILIYWGPCWSLVWFCQGVFFSSILERYTCIHADNIFSAFVSSDRSSLRVDVLVYIQLGKAPTFWDLR